jgi:hypothetical protein
MREAGFYWVRFKRIIPAMGDHKPEIAHWDTVRSEWVLSGSEELEPEDVMEVLSERLVPPVDHRVVLAEVALKEWVKP